MISDNQLNQFIGSWSGSEELFATAWTTPGTAHGVLTIAAGPGESLMLDYEEQRDGATLTGHGVVAGDGWWWFDSYGFVPTSPGTARWEDRRLLLERSSVRGRTVTTLELVGESLVQRIETAVPAEAELSPLMHGRYTAQGHSNPGSD